MSRFSLAVLSAVAALVVAATSWMQTASAASTAPLFTVPGVVNRYSLVTLFSCVNTGSVPTTVTVNVLNGDGTAAGSGVSGTLNQDQTWVFGTSLAVGMDADTNMQLSNTLYNGSAKIFSTSKAVMCNAIVLDATNGTPASMTTLRVVGGTKQKF